MSTVVNGKTNAPVIINKTLISHLLVITEVQHCHDNKIRFLGFKVLYVCL